MKKRAYPCKAMCSRHRTSSGLYPVENWTKLQDLACELRMHAIMGFVGSVCSDPKYSEPPRKPTTAHGIVNTCASVLSDPCLVDERGYAPFAIAAAAV